MAEHFEPIILCRKDGRFTKQIKLGDNFMSDINKMANDIFQVNDRCLALNRQVTSLNWKINSILANRIQYNLKGINFNDSSEKISSISANNFARVIETISDGLFALIDDFNNQRASGDPKVIKDHIIMLSLIYQKLKKNKFFKIIVTAEQEEMIEAQFSECIMLFNLSLNQAISQNNWNLAYNMCSAFFGGCYGYAPLPYFANDYFRNCMIDFEELKPIDHNNNYLHIN